MDHADHQAELVGLVWRSLQHPFRLRANDIIRIEGKLARVIRVSESSAVVVMNRQAREFSTRFDKRVRFQPSPVTFRISANSEIEVLNREIGPRKKRKHR